MNKTHADTHWSPNENVTTNTDGETSRTFIPSGTGLATGQFQYVPTGWVCPKCGRALAPHTAYCPCYMEKPSITYRTPTFEPGDSPFSPNVTCMNATNRSEG